MTWKALTATCLRCRRLNKFASAGEIGEIAENYWLALCRDVPFADYGANATVASLRRRTSAPTPTLTGRNRGRRCHRSDGVSEANVTV